MGVHPAFRHGELVRIADRATLDEFYRSYKLHHRLEERQLNYAGEAARVIQASMYHGGDQLYDLEGVPGIWHERLLKPATPESSN